MKMSRKRILNLTVAGLIFGLSTGRLFGDPLTPQQMYLNPDAVPPDNYDYPPYSTGYTAYFTDVTNLQVLPLLVAGGNDYFFTPGVDYTGDITGGNGSITFNRPGPYLVLATYADGSSNYLSFGINFQIHGLTIVPKNGDVPHYGPTTGPTSNWHLEPTPNPDVVVVDPSLAGSEPTHGSNTTVVVALTNWTAVTQYLLTLTNAHVELGGHGSAGNFYYNRELVLSDTTSNTVAWLKAIKGHVTNLTFMSCSTGQGAAGSNFLQNIANKLGASAGYTDIVAGDGSLWAINDGGKQVTFSQQPASANSFEQLAIIVNQLDDAALPDLTARQKEMNDILKKGDTDGRRLRATLVKGRAHADPKDKDGNSIAPDGKVALPNLTDTNAPDDQLRDVAENNEVKTNGVKIWISTQVSVGGTNVNGVTLSSRPNCVIEQQSGTNDINGDARTWTHELFHALDLGHTNDPDNVMFPSRGIVETNGTVRPAGTNAADWQWKDIEDQWKKYSPKTAPTEEQRTNPPAKSPSDWIDKFNRLDPPVAGTAVDLSAAHLVVDHFLIHPATNSLYGDIYINAIPDPGEGDHYMICLDLDNNSSTGSYSFDLGSGEFFVGDALISYAVAPPANEAILYSAAFPAGIPLAPPTLETICKSASGLTNSFDAPIGAMISGSCPLNLLGPMSNQIGVLVVSASAIYPQACWSVPELMTTVPPPEPTLQLDALEALPGSSVSITGTGFSPTSNYRVLLDDVQIASGITGPDGQLSASFAVPALLPDDYLMDAIDDERSMQIAVLRIVPRTICWSGAASSYWDADTTNWAFSGIPADYNQGDFVFFDETASRTNVNLTMRLCPGGVTVSNNAHPYTFTGPGGFSGGMSLTKQGSGTLIIANTGTNVFSGGMTVGGGTVQVGPGSFSSIDYGPIVNYGSLVVTATNPVTINDFITGRGSLTKSSTGILLLLATNSYTGSTYINSGTLALGTNGSISISGIISVNGNAKFDVSSVSNYTLYGGQTLQGSGTVTGNVAVVSGAAIYPGGAGVMGTLSFSNNLSLNAGVTNYFELAPAPGTGNDLIQVAGDLQPNGATIALTATGALSTNGSYRLFNYGGGKTNSFSGAASQTRYMLTLDESTVHQINLIVSGSGADLVWAGDGLSNCWDVCNSANFNDNLEPFHQADSVTFDDTSMNSPVNLIGTLYPASVTVNSSCDYVFQGPGRISGATGLTKAGTGTLTICSPNDYKGPTLILGGSLSLSQPDGVLNGSTNISISADAVLWATGRADQTLKLANGQTLSGNGMVVAPNAVVGAGATVAPGSNTVGQLTFSGNLTFQSGSTAAVELNKAAGINDQIVGVTTLIYGGTLRATNISATPLAAGDSFKLFDAENYLGMFAGVVPATPGSGLRWSTNALASNGTLTVVAAPRPGVSSVTLWSGTNLVICCTNGTFGMPCYVLASTDLASPLTNWTVLATNSFGPGGSISFTNTITPGVLQRFYRLQTQ